jgi:ribosomal protein S18 acetylase RimI-like enzyme
VTGVRLEPGTLADAADCLRLRDEAAGWLRARGLDQWRPGEVELADVERSVHDGELLVVREGGRVVATATVTAADPDVWGSGPGVDDVPARYVHRLVVSREAAGRGLGRAVLRAVEADAAAAGCTVVRLDCVEGNAALRRWYLADGYRVVGSRDWARQFGGRLLPAVLLQKRVPAGGPPVDGASSGSATSFQAG